MIVLSVAFNVIVSFLPTMYWDIDESEVQVYSMVMLSELLETILNLLRSRYSLFPTFPDVMYSPVLPSSEN